ncbi:DUF58 domain-containing protein [Subtercola frigoramans]|uniref:Uncharacterized protein (DUF58 family) n=1 Tax=Subtercola frigoramans TaxID=120298 RepID=A0ABS2L3I4_9MICO|nr:DUF58 domain-containing protein [Subtercola frigoramans]MBM7471579.1 uncharacterized protein (DUF58 family) [Subtercola frigoramans]
MSKLPRLTLRGWGFVSVAVVFFVVMQVLQHREFSFVALFLLALPLIGLASVSLYRLPLTVERRFQPELAPAGSLVTVRLTLRNEGVRAAPEASWSDSAEAPLAPSEPAELPLLRGFRSSRSDAPTAHALSYERNATHRGHHAIGPLVLLLVDPFGMAYRRASVGATDVLTVTPSIVPLPRGALRLAAGSGAAQQSRQLGSGGEHDVISRKYQTGDSMRRVNWSATARFGELMVRQDDQQNDQHAVVILDSSRQSYRSVSEQRSVSGRSGREHQGGGSWSPEFEWAVSMAASIGVHLLEEGFHVRVVDSAHPEGRQFEPDSAGTFADLPGEHALLLHSAQADLVDAVDVDFRHAVTRDDSVAGDAPPLFAVVGRLGATSTQTLAVAARLASSAVAVIVVPGEHVGPGGRAEPGKREASGGREARRDPDWAVALRDVLEDSGWVAQIVSSDDAPSSVWGTSSGERLTL